MTPAVRVDRLVKTYTLSAPPWHRGRKVEAVRDISLSATFGSTLAIVGESGSGKTTLARILVGLEQPTSGHVEVAGQPVQKLLRRGPAEFGRVVQYVFQDPASSLNPRHSLDAILDAPLRILLQLPRGDRERRKVELLDAVGLPRESLDRFPHEFSGGQAQRIAIARALAAEAKIVLLDEPVSSLDVSVQAQVLLLLDRLKKEFGLTYVLISHDLGVVDALADTVAVMYLGKVVELGPTRDVFSAPQHPYTQQLLRSVPQLKLN
jgi:peptide/nickel transport system ATP-binding protein